MRRGVVADPQDREAIYRTQAARRGGGPPPTPPRTAVGAADQPDPAPLRRFVITPRFAEALEEAGLTDRPAEALVYLTRLLVAGRAMLDTIPRTLARTPPRKWRTRRGLIELQSQTQVEVDELAVIIGAALGA